MYRTEMADYRIILFTLLAITVLCISESQARPRVPRDLFAEYENNYDAMNKNEESFNVPNDYEPKANDYEDKRNDYENKDGCNTPMGGWFC